MAATGNVTLRLSMSGDNSVSARLDQIKGKTDRFNKPVTVRINLNDVEAQAKISNIFHELESLNRTQGTIHMKFPDYPSALAQLDKLRERTRELDGKVIKENIKINGVGQAMLEFSALAKAADNAEKRSRRFSVRGMLGMGGGSGGGFNGFQGISGVGSGASAAVIEGLTSPYGAAAAAATAPFAGTALAGGLVGAAGAGLAGLGIAGAMGAGTSKAADITAAQNTLHAAQLRVIADTDKLNKLQSSGKATAAQLASAQAALASAHGSVITAQQKLNEMPPVASKQVLATQNAFQNLSNNARKSLTTIGASFAPVMTTIFDTLSKTITKLTPVFAGAEKVISGPFKQMGVILATSLGSPQVVTSVKAVATAFADFLKVFSPQIPGIVNSLAGGLTDMAKAFTDHPGMIVGMANTVDFLLKLPGYVFAALGALTRVTSWLTSGLPHDVSIGLDASRKMFINFGHGVESVWNSMWGNVGKAAAVSTGGVTSVVARYWNNIAGFFARGYNDVVGVYSRIKTWVTSNFDAWWANNGAAVISVWNGMWQRVKSIATNAWGGILFGVKGFWNVITTTFNIGKTLVLGVWGAIWPIVRAVFQAAWTIVQYAVQAGWVVIRTAFQVGTETVSLLWRNTWAIIKFVAEQAWAAVRTVIKIGWDIIVGLFGAFINVLTGRWGAAWNDIRNMFVQVWNAMRSFLQGSLTRMWQTIVTTWTNVFHYFGTVPGQILHAIGSLSGLLVNVGHNVIDGLFHGILQALSNVGGWVKANIFNPIVGAIKSLFGIHSPSTVMADMGGHLISGLIKGLLHADPSAMIGKIFGSLPEALGSLVGKGLVAIEHLPAKALKALGSVAGKIGGFFSHIFGGGGSGGVGQWMGVVLEALALNGLPAGLASRVLFQMQTESGGNPNAINLSDINAQHGDPSRGLLQTIGSTFAAYHIAGTSNNIYDPLANVAAAINYAKHTYGPSLMSGGMGMGSGHGYAGGTHGAAPGWAWVGENGRELVHFKGGEQVVANHQLGLAGYAAGTNPGLVAAEIEKLRATIARYEYDIAHSKIATQRNVYRADIRVDEARLNALLHPAAHHIRAHHVSTKAEQNAGLSLYFAYAHGASMTAAKIRSEQTTYLKDLSKYFSGNAMTWRDHMVERQTRAMENAAVKLASLEKNDANARKYASSVTSNLSGYAGLANIDLNNGGGIVGGIVGKLTRLKSFASMLTRLRSRGVNTGIISQIINMGPDSGYEYAAALVGAGAGTINAVNSAERQIGSVTASVGRSAALAVYGVDIAKGLTSQEKSLKSLMHRLGTELGKEAAAWFKVPRSRLPRGFASGTSSAPSGWAMVGENGPELVFFGGGERVVPTGQIRGGDGARAPMHIENLNINFRGQPLHTKAEIGRTVKEAMAYAERHGN